MPYRNPEEQTAYGKAHYQKYRQYYIDKAKRSKKRISAMWHEYKKTLVCKRCGKNPHPVAIQFHHRDPADKKYNVSNMIHRGMGKERIMTEIAKCDVLCANCHAIVEYELNNPG